MFKNLYLSSGKSLSVAIFSLMRKSIACHITIIVFVFKITCKHVITVVLAQIVLTDLVLFYYIKLFSFVVIIINIYERKGITAQ